MTQCTACGRSVPLDAAFCPGCGRPVEVVALPARADGAATTTASTGDSAGQHAQRGGPEMTQPSREQAAAGPDGREEGEVAVPLPEAATKAGHSADSDPGARRTVRLLAVLSGLLALALTLAGLLAFVELGRRDAREQELRGQVASLTQANRDFQSQVQSLTSERDGLAAERDQLLSRVSELEATKAEQEQRIRELTGQVEEQSRQLTQAREEATRQQQRADAATNVSLILGQVVAIDEEIFQEYRQLSMAVLEMQDAYYFGNRMAFESAARRADESARRLDQLFAERDRLLAQLGY